VYTVTVTATDPGGMSASEQFTWTVTNPGPDAVDDNATVDEDSSINIAVLTNDSDPDLDDISVLSITQPENGTAVLENDGTVTYIPDADFSGSDAFTYTLTDGEGGSDTATVYLTVDPSAIPAVTATTDALVDEDDLSPQGIGNTDSPQDDTANPGGTIEFTVGQDGLSDIALSSTTTGITTLDGSAVRFFWDGDAGTLLGYTGDIEPDAAEFDAGNRVVSVTLGSPSVAGDGSGSVSYSVVLHQSVTHPGADEDADNVAFDVNVVVTDEDNDSSDGSEYFTVEIDDDMPVAFAADPATVLDGSGVSVTEDLNFYIADGADGDGNVVFAGEVGSDPVQAYDSAGNPLSLEGEPLYVFGAGTDTLVIKTLGATDEEAAFRIDISGDQYTVTSLNGVISNGTELSDAQFDNISGGNNEAVYLTDPFSTDGAELDVILNGIDFHSEQNTVNTSNGLIGVGAGKEIAFDNGGGDSVSMEFVVLDDDANPSAGSSPAKVNDVHLPVQYKGGGITQVSFKVEYYLAGALLGSQIKVVADAANNRLTGEGADLHWAGGFDKVVITAVDQGSKNAFNIGGFSLTQLTQGDDIVFNTGIVGSDRDGDSVTSSISVAIDAPEVVAAPDIQVSSVPQAADQPEAPAVDDQSESISTGDDILVALDGQDDIFVWNPDNLGGDDTVQNFGTQDGDHDAIALRDLIPEEADATQYLHIESVATGDSVNTVISVDADGEGKFNGSGSEQTITIEGVDLTGGYSDVADIIKHMVDSEHLDV
jgi:hypothetical protein